MFISNAEKDRLRIMIQSAQASISELARENQAMKQAIIDLEERLKTKQKPVVKTTDAPWGLKKDGTPKNRPGRKLKTESQECIIPI